MRFLVLFTIALVVTHPSWAQSGAARGPHQIAMENDGGQILAEVYVVPAVSDDWGENRLLSGVPSGSSATLRYAGPCIANVRVVMGDRRVDERRGVNVCSGTLLTLTATSITQVSDGTEMPEGADPVQLATPVAVPAPPSAAARPTASATALMPRPFRNVAAIVSARGDAGAIDPTRWNGHYLTQRYGGL